MVELRVSDRNVTWGEVDWSRRERWRMVGLLRLPPEPRQFQARCVMVSAEPLKPAP
jgi:hypothetical protein